MTTINLRDGLEALYYFGEQDFDPQRNLLQDHSGYGRHASANGSVTVDNEGVNDFDAATFTSSSNDAFDAGDHDLYTDSVSFFALFKPNKDVIGETVSVVFDNGDSNSAGPTGQGLTIRISNGELRSKIYNSNENQVQSHEIDRDFSEKWYRVIVTVDGSAFKSFTQDGLQVITKGINGIAPSPGIHIGELGDGDAHFDGKIASIGLWSRVLYKQEISYLIDQTAPLRAQL